MKITMLPNPNPPTTTPETQWAQNLDLAFKAPHRIARKPVPAYDPKEFLAADTFQRVESPPPRYSLVVSELDLKSPITKAVEIQSIAESKQSGSSVAKLGRRISRMFR